MFKALANLWVAILCGVGLIFVGLVAIYISLPDVTILRKCIVTEMYHVRLCENDSTFVPFDKISPYIVGAVIMSEDASFYFHAGVDVDEMKESFIKDAEKMRFARGASTITQQLAKNVFLSGEKSPVRKIQEILIAVQLERYFTKKQLSARCL